MEWYRSLYARPVNAFTPEPVGGGGAGGAAAESLRSSLCFFMAQAKKTERVYGQAVSHDDCMSRSAPAKGYCAKRFAGRASISCRPPWLHGALLHSSRWT
jgi:hypothetical protein